MVTLSADFTDVGTLDSHRVVIDWGDATTSSSDLTPGDFTIFIDSTGGGTGSFEATHTYATGGIFQITVTVIDDDTGDVISETEAWVTGVRVTDDGVLQIICSAGEDEIDIGGEGSEGGEGGEGGGNFIEVDATFNEGGEGAEGAEGNFVFYTDETPINSILIHLCEGDDEVDIDKGILIPATIFGGAGDDDLEGGGGDDVIYGEDGKDDVDGGEGNDILLGGAGNDKLDGDKGLDILLGGYGQDDLRGGKEDDILIGALVSLDDAQLDLARNIWTNGDTYDNRVAELTTPILGGGSGLLVPNVTVTDDNAEDKLKGDGDRDLFFADLGGLDEDDVDDQKADEDLFQLF